MLKKIWKFISSMRLAILLLLILVAACVLGSVIPQGQDFARYAALYSERSAAFIIAAHLDDVYHSVWFLLIGGFLCCNLLLCNLLRLPSLVRRSRAYADPAQLRVGAAVASQEGVTEPESVFAALRMPGPKQAGDGTLYAVKNRAGLWGAWVCHLGILLLILGFGLGQMTHREYAVYGVPGQTLPIGDTGYDLSINDFKVDLREDDTVAQYVADITVRSAERGVSESAMICVNHPANLFGFSFYQNSTGWAARARVWKDGSLLQEEILCAGECLNVLDKPDLTVCLRAFYPDYVFTEGAGPSTASGRLNNPAYLYSVTYKGELVGMNALTGDESIHIDEYEIRFDAPRNYTVIQIKRDRFTSLALFGGLVTMLGLFLAFYLPPEKIWATRDAGGAWTVFAYSQKGGMLFAERFRRATDKM